MTKRVDGFYHGDRRVRQWKNMTAEDYLRVKQGAAYRKGRLKAQKKRKAAFESWLKKYHSGGDGKQGTD